MQTRYFIFGSIIGTLLIAAVLLLAYRLDHRLTSANTILVNKNYSHLTATQVTARLNTDFPLPATLTLVSPESKITFSTASISASIDPLVTSRQLLPRARDGFVVWLKSKIRPPTTPQSHPLAFSYDRNSLKTYLTQLSTQYEKPYIPTELVVTKDKITIKNGEPGQKLNTQKLENLIFENLQTWHLSQEISLPLEPIGQLPSDDQVASTQQKAESLIGKQITLIADEQKVTIDSATLISWLDFSTALNQTKINEYSTLTATNLKKDPINAIFKFENNKVLEFRPAASGVTFDPQKITQSIVSQFEKLNMPDLKNLDITLTPDYQLPAIKTADVNDLGIRELLGRGTSTFKHSSAVRNINIEKGSSIVNRVLVAPNEEFSFLKSLGEVTLEAGFKKAYIIRQGKTELDVGGGVCQVSTTFFRAMLNSGVNITHRMHHAYRVSYYEEDMPPGYDATVFIPNPDLKFINDTGHHILIQNTYDGVNKTLTYEFYGTSDGRTVDISNYRQWASTPAPPDRWIDDPTLEPGKVVQDERRIAGLKTAFDWKVTRNGEVIRQKTFQSNFVPWAAVYRRGPAIQ